MDPIAAAPLLIYSALALATVLLRDPGPRALAGMGLALAALGVAADRVGGPSPGSVFAVINGILVSSGVLLVGHALWWSWRDRGTVTPPVVVPGPRFRPDVLLLAGLLFAAFGAHLILVGAGIFLALVSGAATALRCRRVRWLGLVAFGAALLGGGFFLLFTILGPAGGRMSEIAGGPFSPAAERLLAILLGLGSLVITGVFPFHLAPWRLCLAPVAVILLARVLIPALPGGHGDWQAPAMLWLAVGVAAAALSGRWAAAMVAGGLLGIWSGRPDGVASGCALLFFGWLADVKALPARRLGGERWAGVWFMVPAASIPFVLDAALSAQVLVTVLAVAAAVAGLGLESRRRARAG